MSIGGIEINRDGVSVSNPLSENDAFGRGVRSAWDKSTSGNPLDNWAGTPGQWWDDSRYKVETEYERIGSQIKDEYTRLEDRVKNAFENWGSGVEAQTNELAFLNAQAIQDEAKEQIRRSRLQFEDLKSQVTGIQSSSGFLSSTGTNKDYINKMESSFQQEIDYINKTTESRVEITILEGQIQGKIAKNNERAGDVGVATDVIGIFT